VIFLSIRARSIRGRNTFKIEPPFRQQRPIILPIIAQPINPAEPTDRPTRFRTRGRKSAREEKIRAIPIIMSFGTLSATKTRRTTDEPAV
ncbi:unnamed protein product, partial [Nesidiocoris tenuis]